MAPHKTRDEKGDQKQEGANGEKALRVGKHEKTAPANRDGL